MIRLLLADDYEIVRVSLNHILKMSNEIQLIAQAKTGKEAVALAHELKPDVILMDLDMPETDGFSASLQLLQGPVHPRILIMSAYEEPTIITCLLEAGILGYISKSHNPDVLFKAIKTVYSGRIYCEHHDRLRHHFMTSPFAVLSSREMQIMLLLVRGAETKQISEKLFLSQKTVQGHLRKLKKKLKLRKTVELVQLAIKQQLIYPETIQLESESH